VNFDQPEELTEQMRLYKSLINSEVSLDQQVQLNENEDMRDLLMIGGIGVFLPFSQEEGEIYVVGAPIVVEQSAVTVRKEERLEQTLEATQAEAEADEEENERSEEWLNDFGQGDKKKEVVALKLAVKEAKERVGRFITPWEMDLEMLEDWLNNPGPARELTKVELSEKTEQKFS
jgi:hypothetical protein